MPITATPSLDRYLEVAAKAGLPIGDKKQMLQAQPFARFAIGDVVHGEDARSGQLNDERAEKIKQLASMDGRLNDLYKEGSPMHSINPFLKEAALTDLYNVQGANVGLTDQAIVANEKSKEQQINDISKYYSDLITTIGRNKAAQEAEEFNADNLIDEALGETDSVSQSEDDIINEILEGL